MACGGRDLSSRDTKQKNFPESEAEENKEMHDIQSSFKQVTISDDSAKCEDGEEPPKASTPAVKRETGTGQQPDVPVNFQAELLPVTCKETMGLSGGKRNKDGTLPTPPEKDCTNKEEENSDKCKICQDGGKLFHCENCQSFFHGNCHLPPVLKKRTDWKCTFCKTNIPRKRCYNESDVLKMVIGRKRKLKCEFLLLKIYEHLEGNVFPNFLHENNVEEASQCLKKLRKLDKIKDSLLKRHYRSVESFVQAMDDFFTNPSCNDAELTQDNFKKNFKEIFAIRETN